MNVPSLQDEPCVVLDIETSGYPYPAIIDVGVVGLRSGAVLHDQLYGLPWDASWNPHAAAVHRIPQSALLEQPAFVDAWPELRALLDGRIVVGHRIAGDLEQIARATAERPWTRTVCTLKLAQRLLPELPKHRLVDVGRALAVPLPDRLHRALADAQLNRAVYLALRQLALARPALAGAR